MSIEDELDRLHAAATATQAEDWSALFTGFAMAVPLLVKEIRMLREVATDVLDASGDDLPSNHELVIARMRQRARAALRPDRKIGSAL